MPAIVNLLFNAVSANTTIAFTLALPLVSVLSLVAGVGGHLLLWLVLLRCPRRRSRPSSVLLLNLSVADVGALLTLPCVLLVAASRGWQLGGGACVVLGFVTSLTAGGDVFSLAALSVLRHRIVAPPARRPVRPALVGGTVAVIWLVSVAMALPKVTYVRFDAGCRWSVDRDEWLGFLVPAFLVYYVAPLLCIGVNCALIVAHLRSSRLGPAATRRNQKATALLIGSTLAFALSWLPYYALEFVNVMSPAAGFASSFASSSSSSSSSSSLFFPLSGGKPWDAAAAWTNRSLPQAQATPPPPTPQATPPTPLAPPSVTLVWELASLFAIVLVCLAPCWNPPLYFLLSRHALRQLRALLPSPGKRWGHARVAPATAPRHAPPMPPPLPSLSHTLTQG